MAKKTFYPTYLYIKRHKVTGLLYFGKTTRTGKVFESYLGSGKYWSDHLAVHGKEHVETIWYCLFLDKDDLEKFATMCSEQWNIVNATNSEGKKIWANLKNEDGLMGGNEKGVGKGRKNTSESKKKASLSMKGKNTWIKGRSWTDEERKTRKPRHGQNNSFYGKTHSVNTRLAMSSEWEITTPLGETLVVKNMKMFCDENNLNDKLMYRAASACKKYRGFRPVKISKEEEPS